MFIVELKLQDGGKFQGVEMRNGRSNKCPYAAKLYTATQGKCFKRLIDPIFGTSCKQERVKWEPAVGKIGGTVEGIQRLETWSCIWWTRENGTWYWKGEDREGKLWIEHYTCLGSIQVLRNAIFLEIGPPPTPS